VTISPTLKTWKIDGYNNHFWPGPKQLFFVTSFIIMNERRFSPMKNDEFIHSSHGTWSAIYATKHLWQYKIHLECQTILPSQNS